MFHSMFQFGPKDPDWFYIETVSNNNLVRVSRIAFALLCLGDCALTAIMVFTEWKVPQGVIIITFFVLLCISYYASKQEECPTEPSKFLKQIQCQLLSFQSPRVICWIYGRAICPFRIGDFMLVQYHDAFMRQQRQLHFRIYPFGNDMIHIRFKKKVLVAKDVSELEHKIEKHGGVVLEIDDSYGQVKWRKSPKYIFPSNFNSQLYKAILFIRDTRSIVVNLLWVVMLIIWGVRSGHFNV